MVSWNNWRFLRFMTEDEVVCIGGSAWRVLVRGANIREGLGLGTMVSRANEPFAA